jgi:hypothetical protein
MDTNQTLTAIGTIIALVATFITALTSARSSSFNELKQVVEMLKLQLAEQKKTIEEQAEKITELTLEVDVERQLRKGYELYTKALAAILKKANIKAPDIKNYIPPKRQKESHTHNIE